MLDSAGSLIVIIASQVTGMRKCCYTVPVLSLRLKQAKQLEQGSVVRQCWFSYYDYSKLCGLSQEVLLDSAGSLIVIKASQVVGMRECC